MAERPAYPPDAAICRLLAVEALPTAAIADRLVMPDRTVRHRLHQLHRAGVVVTGPDGLHRLAAPGGGDLAEPDRPLAAPGSAAHAGFGGPGGRSGSDDGWWPIIAALAAALIGCAAVIAIGRLPAAPPARSAGFDGFDDPWRGVEW